MTNKTLEDLNRLYNEGEEVDQKVWAEMRSNILLISGDHYARSTNSRFNDRIRDNKDIPQEIKLRLTRNHIQRLSKIYINAITSLAPGTCMEPANPKVLQDQKAAEQHQSVWHHLKKDLRYPQKVAEFAGDFINFGECAAKVYWDWQKGIFKGYDQKPSVDEEGNQLQDEMGQPMMEEDKEKSLWSGALVVERIYAFNLFRPRSCQDMHDAEWIGIRKMANRKEIKMLIGDDEEKLKALEDQSKTTYMVFDIHKAAYEMAKDQVMLREIYYKPSPLYPNGYYYVFTSGGILFEGELPFGIFPIVWEGFDQVPTSPRALSPIKTWKPYQVEINRVASKMAEHQITLGDDKVVVGNNAKISSAGTAPGLRAYSVSGPSTPVYLPGRTGDQYLPYLDKTIQELYQTAMVAEILDEKLTAQVDPYAILLQTARWKQKFSMYSEKFERFQLALTEVCIELYRRYVPNDTLIAVLGKGETMNISEFKNSKPLGYQIEMEPQTDDVESRMGRQLTLNHIIQFAGQNLDKSDLGKLFRQLPYLDNEEVMSDLTIDYDNATNDILALERGELPPVNQYDNHPYVINRLVKRMREPDFRFLPPNIQQNFEQIKAQHEQAEAQKQAAIQRQQAGFIPTTGYLVNTQVYAPDPNNPKVTKPLKLPYDAISWLAKQLENQGMGQQELQQMNDGALAEMASQFQTPPQPGGMPGQPPPGQPQGPQMPVQGPQGQVLNMGHRPVLTIGRK